jgi:hypothetical protein
MTTFSLVPEYIPPVETARTWGTEYTPQYVRDWLGSSLDENDEVAVPATLAALSAATGIPEASMLDYRTGNAGGAFASYDAWVAAGLAQDKYLVFDIDLAPSTMTFSYLARGMLGYGATMPSFTPPSSLGTGCRLGGYRWDLTIRFIRFVRVKAFLKLTRELTAQTISGTLQQAPYHYTSSGPYVVAQPFPTSVMHRVGALRGVSGAGDIASIVIKRWVSGGAPSWSANWNIRNPLFEGYVDGVSDNYPKLINGAVNAATASSLAAAINAYTATSTISAVAVGDDVFLFTSTKSKEPQWLEIDCTGTLEHEECGIGVDISCCEFVDCDSFMYQVSDSTAAGKIRVFKNKGYGSWGLVFLYTLRRTYVRVACNEWSDALATRTTAPHRTSSRMPSGSNQSHYNTFFYAGTNNYLMSVFNATDEMYENNYIHDWESLNNTDTVNCAVAFDLRDNSLDCRIEELNTVIGQFEMSWNIFEEMIGINGAEDCQPVYLKLRGGRIANNKWKHTGGPWKSALTTENGSECGGLLIKEAQANFGMPQCVVEGNLFEDMPGGIPVFKADYQYNLIVRYNHVRRYQNTLDGTNTNTDPAHGALFRITNDIGLCHVHSNFFENVNLRGQPFAISLHNVSLRTPLANNDVEISNNIMQNDGTADYPAYTADTTTMRYQAGTTPPSDPASFFGSFAKIGLNKVLSAAGAEVGDAGIRYTNSGTVYEGSGNADSKPFASYVP